ncbi:MULTISPECIES: group II intron reverse transcriptase/maturase [unclassified Tolypothrix]|uniref:group II intron reverse transcriptase/maturase n=1 Tax=unclassified Tolypothrix TaxID=2649714 RepID=UPI0005EABA94|nr:MULTISPECIES: reverse transcriptase domain-containing protein [unclassified Tolypothrix]BAY89698.1 reverse transcriptase homolog [Microchaete diplosiphon NIES-3275]EKE97596.1 putative group II intron reverse [Tolypothrix sp. PCC 7601]MBE9085278.1 reverse transcriptase N-terminal domain-containing protein [Tolypothrix sp. LEGE 11397]UYD23964.1 reverse transcriptase N-terminal domain-containing protein [Tolypothrix sp. PCC 7712]UYD33808.1 reverse transcriptase N-terminal domain-containing pro
MIRHSYKTSESWKALPWKKFRRNLFRLQKRVFKAVQVGDKRKARLLQKLILKSTSARFLAIRQVSQLNAGRKTAGIDGKKSLSFEERFNLEELLRVNSGNWKHQGLREIPIPKKDGTIRMLKIPTIADRAWQCLAKHALEPAHEATFHARSYGFRTGRSAHDAQQYIFNNLNSRVNGIEKRVIELDIEKCFDRINHSAIMDELIAPFGLKLGIFRCLKAGVNPEFPEQGTPQGGVVSPLLANIALNGIESIHRYHVNKRQRITDKTSASDITEPSVRYADDMVIILRPEDDATEILERISEFLRKRGMNVSQKKTKITAATDGFDFLDWHFKVQKNGKLRSIPSVDNFKAFHKKVKHIVNNSNYGATTKAEKLAPVVRGWRNYHKFCKMSGSRNSLYHIETRAYKVFNKETKQNRYSSKKLLDKAFPAISYSENKHVIVKGTKSPYDGDTAYWSERNSKLYDGETSKALKKQNHKCASCGLKFIDEERVHLHHIDGNHANWKKNNLEAIHESCHDYKHMSKSAS